MALASTLFLSLPGESTTGTCPSTSSYEWTVDRWSPADGDLAGMRSPIELRKSGDVCSPNGVVYQWVGVWTDSAISQIGWGSQHTLGFCRFTFWETSSYSSGIQWSRCGTDPPGTVRLFKVEDTQYGPPTFIHRFSIYDCGVSGWNGCGSALDAGPAISAFNESHAACPPKSSSRQAAWTDRWAPRTFLPCLEARRATSKARRHTQGPTRFDHSLIT